MKPAPRHQSDDQVAYELQRRLAAFNRERLTPHLDESQWQSSAMSDYELRVAESRFVEGERSQVRSWAEQAPLEPHAFVAWFQQLREQGPGQHDALFDWLAEDASLNDMTWFLRQEMAGEAGFDDLVALTQVKLPTQAKLELARNYWDEMGQGHESGMHGLMLARLGEELGIQSSEHVVWESLALANLMAALAINRHYAYQSIGALGAIEMTAPDRVAKVNAGLKRLGIGGEARRYFALHATLDVKHSVAWNREVLISLIEHDARVARAIAEGALMRLRAGERCFARYRASLGVNAQ